jgi:protein TonB
MKNFLFLAIAFFAVLMVSAQEATTVSNDKVYNTAGIEVKPDFPGGMGEFYKYFAKNYKTPNVKKLNGKVYVTFVVEKDGSINEVKVLRDIGYGTGEEAIRVLNNSPKWIPGEQDGRKVRCSFSLPINIDTR